MTTADETEQWSHCIRRSSSRENTEEALDSPSKTLFVNLLIIDHQSRTVSFVF